MTVTMTPTSSRVAWVCWLALLGACKDDEPVKKPGGTDIDTTPAPLNDLGVWLSAEVTTDDKVAIAYYDRTDDALGFALGTVKDGAVTWAYEKVDSYPDANGLNPGDAGKYASLAIDAAGTTWIAYQDTTNKTLKYAKKVKGGAWETGVADTGSGPSPNAGLWASIAIDKSGNPVIAHYDEGKAQLRVARWNGSGFSGAVAYESEDYTPPDSGASSVDANAGEYAHIFVGSDGTEYIAFYDRAWGALRLAVGDSGGYSVEIVDDSADVGQWPSIVQSGSTLSIAYQDVTAQTLKLATGAPGSFTTEVVDATAFTGADTAPYLDGSSLAIVYFDGDNNDMKLARGGTGSWSSDTVTGSDAAAGFHNEVVSVGGAWYALCYDYTNRGIWFGALP